MNRTSMSDMPGADGFQALTITASAFLIGAVIGSLVASGSGSIAALTEQLSGYINGGGEISFAEALGGMLQYGVLIWLLSFMSIGLLFAPLVIMFRAFLLSFTVTSFVCLLGLRGLAVAVLSLGLQNLIALPALFFLAVQAFSLSRRLFSLSMGQGSRGLFPIYDRYFFIKSAACFMLLLLAALLEAYVCPALASFVNA